MNFKDKVVLLYNAPSSLQKSIALALAQKKATVIITDINERLGLQTVSLINQEEGLAQFIPIGTPSKRTIQELIIKIIREFGPINFAINFAKPTTHSSLLHDTNTKDWDEMIQTQLYPFFYLMKEEIEAMLYHRGGHNVNVISWAGVQGFAEKSAYCAAQHGILGLTKAAALDYQSLGVRINAICTSYPEDFKEKEKNIVQIVNKILCLLEKETSAINNQDT